MGRLVMFCLGGVCCSQGEVEGGNHLSDVRHNTSTDRCSHLTKKKGQSYFYEAHENANTPCSLLCGNKYHSVVNTDQKSTHLVEHADDLELSPSYYSLKKNLWV